MDRERLRSLLADLEAGSLTVEQALERLRDLPFEDLGFARLDHHRSLRNGMPEVILARGKTPEQVGELASRLEAADGAGLVTRASAEHWEAVRRRVPASRWEERAGLILWGERPRRATAPLGVVCAGTSDLPVAEEAALTAEWLGHEVLRAYDVGVAGLHRLLSVREQIARAGVLIVVAGMDGALPSVIAGLEPQPVIAVPTSTGYGSSFEGLSALLAMLNSCAPGVLVVNIDNGFGAAAAAHRILWREPK